MTRDNANNGPDTPGNDRREDILAVGLTDEQMRATPKQLFATLSDAIVNVPFSGLSHARLRGAMLVVSPLLGPDFDAIDLARTLSEMDFKGRYLAFGEAVPNPQMIRREVVAIAPQLSFEIVEMGGGLHVARSDDPDPSTA